MADEKKASPAKSSAPGPLRRKRKQQRRRPPPRKREAAAEGGGEGRWPEGEGGAGPERGGRARGRSGKRSRGGSRGRGGRGRPWRGRRGGPWGPPAEWEGGAGPWAPGEQPWDEGQPWGPAEEDMGPPPWGPPEMDGGEGPWGPPGMDAGPWGPSEEGMAGQPWEMEDRPPSERDGRGGRWGPPEMEGREGPWGPPRREGRGRPREPPERNGRGPPEREGREPSRGSPGRGMSPTREPWAAPQEGMWGRPGPEMHRSGPPSSLGWEPHRGELRSRWGRGEARQELRGQGPAKPWRGRSESPPGGRERSHPPEKLRRIWWDGPEGREGEQVPPGRSQAGRGSLEGLRRQQDPNRESRAWREGSRDHSYPTRHQLQPDAMGAGGQWSSPKEMEGELPGPSREEWGWDSPSRARWQTGEERDPTYSPKWEVGREHFRGQSPLDQRRRGHLSHYDGESATKSPHRQWHPEDHQASFQEGWGPRGGRVDREIERDWTKEEGHGGGEGDLGATAAPAAVPKEWTPCEQVLGFWERCRTVLKKKPRKHMLSTCPRPTLPDRSSETPELNSSVSAMLKPQQQKEVTCASRSLHSLQDEVLDMLGPAMTLYEMAEEALGKGEAVDPMEMREWARRLVRYIGSINQKLTLQRRVVVLGAIHPRLKCVTTKMAGQSTDALLFAEDKVKLLKEIIKRFPQLAQAPRRAHPFLRPSYNKRKAPVRPAPHHPHSAKKPYRRSPDFPPAYFAADHHEEELH